MARNQQDTGFNSWNLLSGVCKVSTQLRFIHYDGCIIGKQCSLYRFCRIADTISAE